MRGFQAGKKIAAQISWEARSRRILVVTHRRRLEVTTERALRQQLARAAAALVWDAGYPPEEWGLGILSPLNDDLSGIGEHLAVADPPLALQLVLETAKHLQRIQPKPHKWRISAARAWGPAIATTVTGISVSEIEIMVRQLMEVDEILGRLAVTASAEQLRLVPKWLRDLVSQMPSHTRKRLTVTLQRHAREGNQRALRAMLDYRVPA
jgi:hypothetical protein